MYLLLLTTFLIEKLIMVIQFMTEKILGKLVVAVVVVVYVI